MHNPQLSNNPRCHYQHKNIISAKPSINPLYISIVKCNVLPLWALLTDIRLIVGNIKTTTTCDLLSFFVKIFQFIKNCQNSFQRNKYYFALQKMGQNLGFGSIYFISKSPWCCNILFLRSSFIFVNLRNHHWIPSS
jgi:hypothetical protein